MARIKTYDPKKVTIIFGSRIITGFSDGTFVSVESAGDGITAIIGCDQEVVRSISPDGVLKTVTISLLQTSESNDYFSKCYDEDYTTGQNIKNLIIKDLMGNSKFSTSQAWVVKKPNLVRGKTAGEGGVEWQLQCVVTEDNYTIGGAAI